MTHLTEGNCYIVSDYGMIIVYSITVVGESVVTADSICFSRESMFWEFDEEVPKRLLVNCAPAPPDLCERLLTLCKECRTDVQKLVEESRGENVTNLEIGKTYGCDDYMLFTLLPPLFGDEDEALLHFYDEGQIVISNEREPLFDAAETTCFSVAEDTIRKMSKIVMDYIGKAWQLSYPYIIVAPEKEL